MASILDRYGIKEVADVTFYELNNDGTPRYPVLYLDTLKVSTIEQTAEESDARGGKGNAALISWDYGKEITVTLEDALFSAKSMAIMFGNGSVDTYTGEKALIMKTEQFVATGGEQGAEVGVPSGAADASGWKYRYEGPDGMLYVKQNPKFYDVNGKQITDKLVVGERYFCSFDLRLMVLLLISLLTASLVLIMLLVILMLVLRPLVRMNSSSSLFLRPRFSLKIPLLLRPRVILLSSI